MTLAIWYWVFLILGYFGGGWYYRGQPLIWGFGGLSFVLFAILGVAVFGSPVK